LSLGVRGRLRSLLLKKGFVMAKQATKRTARASKTHLQVDKLETNLPKEVEAARQFLEGAGHDVCEHDGIDPKQILEFRVYADGVALVLWTGQKYTVGLGDLVDYLKGK
jgi:hypothetical protein